MREWIRGDTRQATNPRSTQPEALMHVRFFRPGGLTGAIASRLPSLQQFTGEVIPALPKAAAAERGRSRTGQRP
jgi:hypothetical protein